MHDDFTTYLEKIKIHAILVTLLYFCIVFIPKDTWAGGIYIDKGNQQLNKSYDQRKFEINEPIDKEFAYAGKPNAYIVFEYIKSVKTTRKIKFVCCSLSKREIMWQSQIPFASPRK